jgi:PilZ domain
VTTLTILRRNANPICPHRRTNLMPSLIVGVLLAGSSRIKAIFAAPREYPRADLATDVKVEGHDLTFTARSVQLGTKGMSLEDAGQLSLAQPVLLRFTLPSGRTVKVDAVVRWKTNELVGLRFDPRENNPHIREWIGWGATLSSEPI